MNYFLLNIALAVTWAALTGGFTLAGLAVGFALGHVALWFTQPIFGGHSPYFTRVRRSVELLVFFHYELVTSSLEVAWDVLTPQHKAKPRLVEMPLDVRSDAEILLVTNLISLTPGTLSLDVSEDRRTLLVHAMFGDDPEALVRDLKQGMERRVQRVFE